MRRVLTFLTAAVLLLVSLGVGLFTADLPFWRRALQLPLFGLIAVCVPDVVLPRAQDIVAAMPLAQQAAAADDDLGEPDAGWLPA